MVARGAILIVSTGGRVRGKPRPAVVVQELRLDFAETIIVVPLSSYEAVEDPATPILAPDDVNGLSEASRFMTHRIGAIPKSDIGKVIGTLSPEDMERVDAALSLVLGLNAG